MDKITKALEKARQQRQFESGDTNLTDNGSIIAPHKIEYTDTQSVDVASHLKHQNRIISAIDNNTYTDAIKILGTQVLQRMEENQWNSLAVTSPSDKEGKTTIAINLSISIAKQIEYTVLLVDANLKKPSVHEYFGLRPKYGLSDYLLSDIKLSDALFHPKGIDSLVVLPAGTPISNSSEMLASPKMSALVEELKHRYPKRIIVYDLQPILNTADTLSFIPYVDSTLIVVEDDVTREIELKKAVELMSTTNVIGTVLNKMMY